MKTYKKLILPNDSAWGRKSWRRFFHWRILEAIDGTKNIIRWIPTLYNDRDWDHTYITKILQKKLEFQRKYLVKNNRHVNIDNDNFWMTVALNLLERMHEDYYALEKYEYHEQNMEFIPIPNSTNSELRFVTKWENLKAYLAKYPATVRKVKKLYPENYDGQQGLELLSFRVSHHNQEKCNNLLFEIFKRYHERWWD
jgi:hypothetical protein